MELIEIALPILSRWLHMIAAGTLLGSVFFFHVILPLGARGLDAQGQEIVYARSRRGFKMTVHVSLLLFLASGIYNLMKNWPAYNSANHSQRGLMHGLFGLHILLGLGGITVLMIMLAGRTPRPARAEVGHDGCCWRLVLGIGAASAASRPGERAGSHVATAGQDHSAEVVPVMSSWWLWLARGDRRSSRAVCKRTAMRRFQNRVVTRASRPCLEPAGRSWARFADLSKQNAPSTAGTAPGIAVLR